MEKRAPTEGYGRIQTGPYREHREAREGKDKTCESWGLTEKIETGPGFAPKDLGGVTPRSINLCLTSPQPGTGRHQTVENPRGAAPDRRPTSPKDARHGQPR